MKQKEKNTKISIKLHKINYKKDIERQKINIERCRNKKGQIKSQNKAQGDETDKVTRMQRQKRKQKETKRTNKRTKWMHKHIQ